MRSTLRALLLLLSLSACAAEPPPSPAPASAEPGDPGAEIGAALRDLDVLEEVLIVAYGELTDVARGMEELELPARRARQWFADSVQVRDATRLTPMTPNPDLASSHGVVEAQGVLGESRVSARADLNLLRPLFERLHTVEQASLSIVDGEVDEASRRVTLDVKLRVRGTTPGGGRVVARGAIIAALHQTEIVPRGQKPRWEIERFELQRLSVSERAAGPMFEEVLSRIASPELAGDLQRSEHWQMVIRAMGEGSAYVPPPGFQYASHDRHPGLAAADVDGDGRDELYVMPRYGVNRLLTLGADGTLEDIAPSLGLDLRDHCSSALFLDLDDDGDRDVVIGRTLAPSLILRNDGGRFVDASAGVDGQLPMLVSSVSAADVDRDGRLDLYFATYSQRGGPLIDPSIAPPDALDRAAYHSIYDGLGPKNVLLLNRGGGAFVRAPDPVATPYRNTYQASFGDADQDGDADLYLAHDYAPNQLLFNRGDGSFEDATDRTGTADVGFGMGASWGDFDGDGDLDLYVSNMFSKAGRRITKRLGYLDPRFAAMARGNSLFRNDGHGFTRVSGDTKPALLVETTGWSWGGVLADVTNDGRLDVAVLNGYFSAPERFARPVDT